MNNLAIITARGGSKRIPRKNIKEFCGRPIIQYSIEAAINSRSFHEVMVSTDDNEIAEISRECGASVPFMRSEKNSNDFASTADVIKEVLDQYEHLGIEFDNFCCVYPTAPFVSGELLDNAMEHMVKNNADSLMSVVKFSFPPQRAVYIDNNRIHMRWPENLNKRSQDLQPLYHDAGQFYIMNVAAFRKHNMLITDCTVPFILEETQVQDIDNMEDWVLAELKFNYLKERKEIWK